MCYVCEEREGAQNRLSLGRKCGIIPQDWSRVEFVRNGWQEA